MKPIFATLESIFRSAQANGGLPDDIDPAHFVYILVGSAGIIFHQAEECKRVSGVDPFDDSAVEAHARAVEYFFLGPRTNTRRTEKQE